MLAYSRIVRKFKKYGGGLEYGVFRIGQRRHLGGRRNRPVPLTYAPRTEPRAGLISPSPGPPSLTCLSLHPMSSSVLHSKNPLAALPSLRRRGREQLAIAAPSLLARRRTSLHRQLWLVRSALAARYCIHLRVRPLQLALSRPSNFLKRSLFP